MTFASLFVRFGTFKTFTAGFDSYVILFLDSYFVIQDIFQLSVIQSFNFHVFTGLSKYFKNKKKNQKLRWIIKVILIV